MTPLLLVYTNSDVLAQASCACYAPKSSAGCTISTFNTGFDDYASACQDFVGYYGYTSVASAMNDVDAIPGPSFCQAVSSAHKKNHTMKATLTPTECKSAKLAKETSGHNATPSSAGIASYSVPTAFNSNTRDALVSAENDAV